VPDPLALLEWFRVDRSRSTRWLLGIGITFVFVGATLVAYGVITHGSELLHALVFPGAILLVVGLVTAFGGMTILLAQDEYIAVRASGILVHRARFDVELAWDDLVSVKHDPTRNTLVFARGSEDPYELDEGYTGVTRPELAAHLEALLRKARQAPLEASHVAPIALGLPHRRPR
jgi:hypothetical protein